MLDLSRNTETQDQLRRRLRNRGWLSKNLKEVQASYGGEWVAIVDEKMVAHGSTSAAVKGEVEGKYPMEEMLILPVPKEAISRPL